MKIVYWTGSGNTEKMAELIAEGIKQGGKEAEVINVSSATEDIFDNEEVEDEASVIEYGKKVANL